MNPYLFWTLFGLLCVAGLSRIIFLVHDEYPRTITAYSWHDVLSLLMNLALMAWMLAQ